MAVNSLFVWVLSGSNGVRSEELVKKNLHLTNVLFSKDTVGYEITTPFMFCVHQKVRHT